MNPRFAAMSLSIAVLLGGCQGTPTRIMHKSLDAPAVRHLFSGNTVESFNLNTRLTSFTYYHPNGQAFQERLWARRLGHWNIQDDGKICLAFDGRELKCRSIVQQDGRYFKTRPDAAGNEQKIVRYRYFRTGNALTKPD